MFFTTKTLNIIEKDRTSVLTPNKSLKNATHSHNGVLQFGPISFNIAIARCILSSNLHPDTIYEAFSSFYRYQVIINTLSSVLTLNKNNFEILRDFSRLTRIGELAQGITYLLAQNHLGLPIVVDFEGFIKNKNPNITSISGRKPDFIAQNHIPPSGRKPYFNGEDQTPNSNCALNFNCTLIEAKGEYVKDKNPYPNTKGKLRQALNQCTSGIRIMKTYLPHYKVVKSYGVCVKVHNEVDHNRISEIQFVDPSYDNSNNEFNIELIQYHYASWFLLMGNMNIFNKLMEQKYIDTGDFDGRNKVEINGVIYYMFDSSKSKIFFNQYFGEQLNSIYRFGDYGIREDVLKVLMGESKKFDTIDLEDTLENDEKKYVIFNDGTIINSE